MFSLHLRHSIQYYAFFFFLWVDCIISNSEVILLFSWTSRSRCRAYTRTSSCLLRAQVPSSSWMVGTYTQSLFIWIFHTSVLSVADELLRYDLNVSFFTSLIILRKNLLIRFRSNISFGCYVKFQVLLVFTLLLN